MTVLVGVALLAVGCAAETETTSAVSGEGHLIVEREQPEGPIAMEGSVSFGRVEAEDGARVAQEGFDAPDHGNDAGSYGYPERATLQLAPGRYTVISFQRACDPSCDKLDPPDDRYTCRRSVEVRDGHEVVVEAQVSLTGCEIEQR